MLIACEYCDLLHRASKLPRGHKALCARCGGRLYGSSVDALERTAALTLTSLVLFVIANTALFMHVSLEGQAQSNQIVSGVIDLAEFDYYPLATLIFFTTMLAPLAKMLVSLYATVPVMAGWRPERAQAKPSMSAAVRGRLMRRSSSRSRERTQSSARPIVSSSLESRR